MNHLRRHMRDAIKPLMSITVIVIALTVTVSNSLLAQSNHVIKLNTTVELDATGDASIQQSLVLPPQPYATLKQQVGNPSRLIRMMQDTSNWNELVDLDGTFEDIGNSVEASYRHVGFSRACRDGSWLVRFSDSEDAALITTHDNIAIFNTAVVTDYGPMSVILRLVVPEGSENLKFDKSENEFTYDFRPDITEGDHGETEFDIDAKPQLMSSLAKLYGDHRFDAMWAARSVFRNTGDQIVRDYRVRFRLSGFSTWSGWKKSRLVYPGQSVIDPFFPVLDLEKIAQMTGSRPVMIETEYQYVLDGEKVIETDSTRIQLTSRNQIVYSSKAADENLDWYEHNDLAPYVLTAFTSSQDPVMQQLAGAVSGLAGGVPASSGDQEAYTFLSAMWDFLEMNKVAYHTPPSWSINGYFGQHVKYGRDVIRNRAGTCIDLSILWASVAKSVGLKSHIALVWGHAFPVIELPGGDLLPIESTMIGQYTFDEAIDQAIANYNDPQSGLMILVDIDAMETAGVHPLDLPRVDDDYLAKMGYQTTASTVPAGQQDDPPSGDHTQTPPSRNNGATLDSRLLGIWHCRVEGNGTTTDLVMQFGEDGSYASAYDTKSRGQGTIDEGAEEGTWYVQDDLLYVETSSENLTCGYQFRNGYLILACDGSEYAFELLED